MSIKTSDGKVFDSAEEMFNHLQKEWDDSPITYKAYFRLKRLADRIIKFPRRTRDKIVRFYQRGRYGVSDMDTFSFDDYMASVMLEGLKRFKVYSDRYVSYEAEPEFPEALDTMIRGFEMIMNHDVWVDFTEEEQKLYDDTWDYLKQYFYYLWW